MQTLIDGAVIVQGNLEGVGRLASRPGVIPVPVTDPFTVNNPFEPKTATKDYDAEHNIWIARDPGSIFIVTNQTYPAKPTTEGYGTPLGHIALDPSAVILIPGKN
jgi:hypothetical protein